MNRIQQLSRDIVRGVIVVPLEEAGDPGLRRARLRSRRAPARKGGASDTPAPRSIR